MTKDNIITTHKENMELLNLNQVHLIQLFDLHRKKISEMNNSLNWATSIISAILIFFNTKLANSKICFDKWYLYIIGILFIIFVCLYAFYKIKSVLFIKDSSSLIGMNSNKIYSANCFIFYYNRGETKKSKIYADLFIEESDEEFTLSKSKEVDDNIHLLEILFYICMAIFFVYILSVPIYYLI